MLLDVIFMFAGAPVDGGQKFTVQFGYDLAKIFNFPGMIAVNSFFKILKRLDGHDHVVAYVTNIVVILI